MVDDLRNSLLSYIRTTQKIIEAAALYKQSDLKLAYQKHSQEYTKYKKTGYNLLVQETDKNPVDFAMDLDQVVRSKNDPLQFFKDNPGRSTL